MLVTGFDPFSSPLGKPPPPGTWNASGAAALALDGSTIPLSDGRVVAVEGIVFSISFKDFNEDDVVRNYIGPTLAKRPGIDAVITVSIGGPGTQLERYSVGVTLTDAPAREATRVGGALGPLIIQAPADLEGIATKARQPSRGRARTPGIKQLRIGTTLTLKLLPNASGSADPVDVLNAALGGGITKMGGDLVEIVDPASGALVALLSGPEVNGLTAKRASGGKATGMQIAFQQVSGPRAGAAFEAELIRGPGGSYRSNELPYRVQQLPGRRPTSFHAHVTSGQNVPTDPADPTAAAALKRATKVRTEVYNSVRRLVEVVGELTPPRPVTDVLDSPLPTMAPDSSAPTG